jgi:GNAT superfamily N-acetyltransferase
VTEGIAIRRAGPADGDALMRAVDAIDRETEFLGVPDQPHPWAARPEAELRSLNENDTGAVFLAVTPDGGIIGYLSAFTGHFLRNRGNIFIAVIGLREDWRGRGIGARLFEAVELWARARRAWRLELRVSSLNERGLALYRKRGFAIEGSIRGGVFRRGAWTDDFWMAKLLEPMPAAVLGSTKGDDTPRQRRPADRRVTVRAMQPGDGAAFHAWDLRMAESFAYALKLPAEVSSEEAIEKDIVSQVSDPRLWLVAIVPEARARDRIVGFASGSIEFGFRMQHDAFVNVVVLPEWTGQDVGRRLHEGIESWARGQGARRLTANVQAPNSAGRAFAGALGYDEEVTMRSYSLIGGAMVDRLRVGKLFAA